MKADFIYLFIYFWKISHRFKPLWLFNQMKLCWVMLFIKRTCADSGVRKHSSAGRADGIFWARKRLVMWLEERLVGNEAELTVTGSFPLLELSVLLMVQWNICLLSKLMSQSSEPIMTEYSSWARSNSLGPFCWQKKDQEAINKKCKYEEMTNEKLATTSKNNTNFYTRSINLIPLVTCNEINKYAI